MGRLLCLLLLLPTLVAAQTPDHAALTAVVRAHVNERGVDYGTLKSQRATLDRYVAGLGRISAAHFDGWSRGDQLAYLINAYNAIVLQSVIDHYPIKRSLNPAALLRPANSVWQIPGFFSDRKHPVAGRQLTLDDIEHRMLRAVLKEPRVHGALVCAARSCPPLRMNAYQGDSIDAQLDDQARTFLNDPARNVLDVKRGTVKLSEIFKWFAEDFGGTEKGVIEFVARHVKPVLQEWLRTGKYRISYFDYDWNLNDAPTR